MLPLMDNPPPNVAVNAKEGEKNTDGKTVSESDPVFFVHQVSNLRARLAQPFSSAHAWPSMCQGMYGITLKYSESARAYAVRHGRGGPEGDQYTHADQATGANSTSVEERRLRYGLINELARAARAQYAWMTAQPALLGAGPAIINALFSVVPNPPAFGGVGFMSDGRGAPWLMEKYPYVSQGTQGDVVGKEEAEPVLEVEDYFFGSTINDPIP
jgi:hypothetical protein